MNSLQEHMAKKVTRQTSRGEKPEPEKLTLVFKSHQLVQPLVQVVMTTNLAASASCSARHMTLPVPLLGSASTNCTTRGYL